MMRPPPDSRDVPQWVCDDPRKGPVALSNATFSVGFLPLQGWLGDDRM